MSDGKYDNVGGGHYYWDEEEDRWWTWETREAIWNKVRRIMGERSGLGGAFAWGLGEDAEGWEHLTALSMGMEDLKVGETGLVLENGDRKGEIKISGAEGGGLRGADEL